MLSQNPNNLTNSLNGRGEPHDFGVDIERALYFSGQQSGRHQRIIGSDNHELLHTGSGDTIDLTDLHNPERKTKRHVDFQDPEFLKNLGKVAGDER